MSDAKPRRQDAPITNGADSTISFGIGQCSVGPILVAQNSKGICAILLGDKAEQLTENLQKLFPRAALVNDGAKLEKPLAQVVAFVESPQSGLDLPLDIHGTAFQERVWEALRQVPAGQTVSYTDLARDIGSPSAVRAVARACAANKLAVVIPCHRVLRSDGGISGYRWGVERKRALLHMEGASLTP